LNPSYYAGSGKTHSAMQFALANPRTNSRRANSSMRRCARYAISAALDSTRSRQQALTWQLHIAFTL
jgi:hypothetical protein